MSASLSEQLIKIATIAAGVLRELGFFGWFDIDFILDREQLFASELNIRRGGGTAPIMFMERLFGPSWMSHMCVKSVERLTLQSPAEPPRIIDIFDRIQSTICSRRQGIFPLSVGGAKLSPARIGLLLYGESVVDVQGVERMARELFRTDGPVLARAMSQN